jgi:hypothetical protein
LPPSYLQSAPAVGGVYLAGLIIDLRPSPAARFVPARRHAYALDHEVACAGRLRRQQSSSSYLSASICCAPPTAPRPLRFARKGTASLSRSFLATGELRRTRFREARPDPPPLFASLGSAAHASHPASLGHAASLHAKSTASSNSRRDSSKVARARVLANGGGRREREPKLEGLGRSWGERRVHER